MFLALFIFFFVVPGIFIKFLFNYNHLLVSLLCLEFMSLSFFYGLFLVSGPLGLEFIYLLYFLVMVVCEGVMGLCLLISMSYFYGSDYLFIYNKLLC